MATATVGSVIPLSPLPAFLRWLRSWLGGISAPPTPPAPPIPLPPAPAADVGAALWAEVNARRAINRLAPLARDPRIEAEASAFAAELAARHTLTHVGLDGSWPRDRIGRVVKWYAAGEDAAEGQRSAAEVVADWMADPPHRAEILDPAYDAMGGGAAVSDAEYWVLDFAKE